MKTRILGLLIAGILATPMAAHALTYYVQGTFSDGGHVSGSFDVNLASCTSTSVNLVTSVNGEFPGFAYHSLQGCGQFMGEPSIAFSITGLQTLFVTFTPPANGTTSFFSTEVFAKSSRTTTGTLTTSPFATLEPGTLALLSMGLLGLCMNRRKVQPARIA